MCLNHNYDSTIWIVSLQLLLQIGTEMKKILALSLFCCESEQFWSSLGEGTGYILKGSFDIFKRDFLSKHSGDAS